MSTTESTYSSRSRAFVVAFRHMSRMISQRSMKSEMSDSELRNTELRNTELQDAEPRDTEPRDTELRDTSGEVTGNNDVFVTEHADQDDVKTEEKVERESQV